MALAITTPKSKSKTLMLNLWAGIAAAVASLPSVLAWFFGVMGDPALSAQIDGIIPAKYRGGFLTIVGVGAAVWNRQLRLQTSTAIEGTPAADVVHQTVNTALAMPPGSTLADLGKVVDAINADPSTVGGVPTPNAAVMIVNGVVDAITPPAGKVGP